MTVAARRIQPGDCLAALHADLCVAGAGIPLFDADAREGWFRACTQVLAAVPDISQRAIWAIQLAESFNRVGLPLRLVAMELWRRVEAAQA